MEPNALPNPGSQRPPTPEILYKYIVPDRIDVLLEKKIRFTQPCFMNDPFEFKPGWPDPGPDGLGPAEKKAADQRYALYGEKSRKCGLCSLTERWDSIPMWAHYAAGHRGFVIGFCTGSSLFRAAIAEGKLHAVEYRPDRPNLTRSQEPPSAPEAIFTTKSCDWSYEKEWRWIECRSPFDYSEVRAASNAELLYLRPISPECIREIVLGFRVGTALTQSIQALSSTAGYEHLNLFKVALDERLYRLSRVPIK